MNSKGPNTEMASLCVMKFGGTSVGDASCIARAAAIVKSAASEGSVVVVVSAMSGVTNRLIDAAHHAEAGEGEYATKVVTELRSHHKKALEALVRDAHRLAEVDQSLGTVLAELERLRPAEIIVPGEAAKVVGATVVAADISTAVAVASGIVNSA